MYSYENRTRAVQLYHKLGRRMTATLSQLGYPSKNSLKAWCAEFELNQALQRGWSIPIRTVRAVSGYFLIRFNLPILSLFHDLRCQIKATIAIFKDYSHFFKLARCQQV